MYLQVEEREKEGEKELEKELEKKRVVKEGIRIGRMSRVEGLQERKSLLDII